MNKLLKTGLVSFFLILIGCIETVPMHNPIFPADSDEVTFSLEASSRAGIERISLYETVSTIDAVGNLTSGSEVFLNEWTFDDSPSSTTVNYTKDEGYSSNSVVTYEFKVETGSYWFWSGSRSHDVTFAIRPYPVDDQPAPVYIQGDVDHVFDVVFIPDTDITNMNIFRNHCRSMITDAVFADPSIRPWTRQFNFYINPDRGTATDYDRISIDGLHQVPANWANISFAEGKVLMHQNDLRDYASGGLFSTEQQNRATMLHEGGHALFGLADEYNSGSHWQASEFPNNWATLASAQADAPDRHKTSADAKAMGTSGWYKICVEECVMKVSGEDLRIYDMPCGDRVLFSIIDNATNP